MIVLCKEFNKEIIKVCHNLLIEGYKIDLYCESQVSLLKTKKGVCLFTLSGKPIRHDRILTVGEVDKSLIKFLSLSKYKGVNSFKGMLPFYTQFDSVIELSNLFPDGFMKTIMYTRGELVFEKIETEIKKINITPLTEFKNELEWIRNTIEDKYNLFYFSITIAKLGNTYYPLSVIPYLNSIDNLEKIIKYEMGRNSR